MRSRVPGFEVHCTNAHQNVDRFSQSDYNRSYGVTPKVLAKRHHQPELSESSALIDFFRLQHSIGGIVARPFYEHFKHSMESAGLQAPMGLFASATVAVASTKALASIVATYGSKVTVAEAIAAVPAGAGAAAVLKQLGIVAGGCLVAYYVGACIGALAYASGEWSAERIWASAAAPGRIVRFAESRGIQISESLRSYLVQDPVFLANVTNTQTIRGPHAIA